MESSIDFTCQRLSVTQSKITPMTIIAGSSQSPSLIHHPTPIVVNNKRTSEDTVPGEVRLEEEKYGRTDSDTTIVSRENVGKLGSIRKHGRGLTEGDNGWYPPYHLSSEYSGLIYARKRGAGHAKKQLGFGDACVSISMCLKV